MTVRTIWWRRLRYALAGSTHPRMRPVACPGRAVRAVIAPCACGGYRLFVDYEYRQEAGGLPTRLEEYAAHARRVASRAAACSGVGRTLHWHDQLHPDTIPLDQCRLDDPQTRTPNASTSGNGQANGDIVGRSLSR